MARWCWLVACLLPLGCRSSAARCDANTVAACVCPQGGAGLQSCARDGTFGACVCQGQTACIPGQSVVCTCDGGVGSQTCQSDHTFTACSCTAPPPSDGGVAGCSPAGSKWPCACTDGSTGLQTCGSDGRLAACGCNPPPPPPPPPPITVNTVLDVPDPVTPDIGAHIEHGPFWASDVALGNNFYWDAYVAPRTQGMLVSDGYTSGAGARHALSWGTKFSPDRSQLIFYGTLWEQNTSIPFTATEGPAPGEWGHHAVGLSTAAGTPYVTVYWNGIAVGVTYFGADVRRTVAIPSSPPTFGQGNLYVMGSSGQTLGGRIAALRAWDRFSPFAVGDDPAWAFIPERSFSAFVGATAVDFLADYTQTAPTIADLSPNGYDGGGTGPRLLHPGVLKNANADQPPSATAPAPSWVTDVTCPYGKAGQLGPNQGERVLTPSTPPAGALVFDSFARASQNFLWQQVPSLGKTESGSLGPRTWTASTLQSPTMPAAFGILNGRAVFLERETALAWVNVATSNQDVRVRRTIGTAQLGLTGVAFRVIDPKSWWYAIYWTPPPSYPVAPYLAVGYYDGGALHEMASYTAPSTNWQSLRVVASGSNVAVYVDDTANGWTQLGTIANATAVAGGTGAGLVGAHIPRESSSLWRADDFTVCAPGGCTP